MLFSGVTFAYRKRCPAVRDLTWEVPHGRTALLGPNGAGKTTLLSIAAGALRPMSGSCAVAGHTARGTYPRGYLREVGWVPQVVRPVRGLRVLEQCAYAGWLKGMSTQAAHSAAAEVLARVGLAQLRDRRSHELSGGQLRRLGLAEALVHQPSQLLLDEPTAGLDPAERERFRRILAALPGGVDVLVSTHEVDDLRDSYDMVAVLAEGSLRFVGGVDSFLAAASERSQRAGRAAQDAYGVLTSSKPLDLA